MERRLRGEEVMTIQVLHERGVTQRAIARQLGVDEKAVRYRLRRLATCAVDARLRAERADPGRGPGRGRACTPYTRKRLVIESSHYEGESTERIEAPIPLGRMGRKLQELWALAPERRAIAQYAALAEVAR
jgi:IS30 family transposase